MNNFSPVLKNVIHVLKILNYRNSVCSVLHVLKILNYRNTMHFSLKAFPEFHSVRCWGHN